jgi:hypothetical protein
MSFQLTKFTNCNEDALKYFVKHGFLIFENLFESSKINTAREYFFKNMLYLENKYEEGNISKDVQKSNTVFTKANQTITANFGNYVKVKELAGFFDFKSGEH